MINIAICDDEIQMTGKIDMLLDKLSKENYIDIDVEVFMDGSELVKSISDGERYDMIFLDIEMKKEDGLLAAKKIRIMDKDVLIIYVTGYEHYMKDAFDVRPFHFLKKPIDNEKFASVFLQACEEIADKDVFFRYRYCRVNKKVLIKNILYFQSNHRKISIVTNDETFYFYGKLNVIEETMKEGKIVFLRIHQSFLVNYRHIESQSYDSIILDNGTKIFISEDRRKVISEQYCLIGDTLHVDNL